jgi:hypothetical protein
MKLPSSSSDITRSSNDDKLPVGARIQPEWRS